MKKQTIARLYCAIFGVKIGEYVRDDNRNYIAITDDNVQMTDEDLAKIFQVIGTTLTEREQKVIGMRFGYGNEDGQPRTLESVADEFNVTIERIRQIEQKALRKLRRRKCREQLPRIFKPEAVLEEVNEIKRRIRELHRDPVFQREAELKDALYKFNQLPFVLPENIEDIEDQAEYASDISELNLSVRAYNCLWRSGIFTVGDLCKLSEAELYEVRNLGVKAAEEVKAKLAKKAYRCCNFVTVERINISSDYMPGIFLLRTVITDSENVIE